MVQLERDTSELVTAGQGDMRTKVRGHTIWAVKEEHCSDTWWPGKKVTPQSEH